MPPTSLRVYLTLGLALAPVLAALLGWPGPAPAVSDPPPRARAAPCRAPRLAGPRPRGERARAPLDRRRSRVPGRSLRAVAPHAGAPARALPVGFPRARGAPA